ncbi:MAG: helix-turn-helix transcriptional regulator [Vagococcus sp.]|jgi:DNA-binding Xre family transcriptional regulator|nr:helix-turn-helix transcriptional regulator [Vagococcus sp.]
MFQFKDNEQLQIELKKVMLDLGYKNVDLAKQFDVTPQSINDMLKKKNFSFKDLQRICEVMNCKLMIDIVPNDKQ